MSIKLVSRRGAIGKSWHAGALRDAAERILGMGRAGSGKADARAGRVQWLDVETGIVRGDVLDADGELYQARVDLPAFAPADREVFLQIARARPDLPARLAGGDYPVDLEKELASSDISLLPRGASELSHDCSCLDWPGPCRHVAALVYVLVEAVDEHPTLLLTLRGFTLEDLVAPRGPSPEGATGERPDAGGVEGDGGGADGESTDGAAGGTGGVPAGSGAETVPPPASYDPARTNPDLLAEVIGDGAANVIARFYGSHARPGPSPADGQDGAPEDPSRS
ncbi:SWIM zinc finger family protein [Brachybacterium sp. FME24]|uniref:SWIM zinc finger family protein n=1 Tax=Brachybacterium sp. FME24 TaxID=2742605 RepID=UPI0018688355|nr:SWIM zinc finger family protein [Brachybacterium sp. FME24]